MNVSKFIFIFSAYLALSVVPLSADTGIMFIDEIYGIRETENIVYGAGSTGNPASGSIDLLLDIFEPTGDNLPEKRPALVMVHGGGLTGGTKDHGYLTSLAENFTKRGYVVVSINYRLTGDDPTLEPGPTTGDTLLNRTQNAACQDAAKAIRWLRQHAATYHIDSTRIGIAGSSAGAITTLFTAALEADTLGPDADAGVVISLWGAMYGAEALFDNEDGAVFLTHGTFDQVVADSESENLSAYLDSINHPHAYYPLAGAYHGSTGGDNSGWNRFYTDTVDGKTILQHSVEFAFEHLKLIEIHPAGSPLTNQSTLSHNPTANELTLSFLTYSGFQYIIQISDDLKTWTAQNALTPIQGEDKTVSFTAPAPTNRRFYRIEVSPTF